MPSWEGREAEGGRPSWGGREAIVGREGGHRGEGGREVIVGREATQGDKGTYPLWQKAVGGGMCSVIRGGGTLLTVNTLQWTSNR